MPRDDASSIVGDYRKRLLDVVLASVGLAVLSPIMIVIGILLRINYGSPVLFVQQRPGLRQETFGLMKFRTMVDARDENGEHLPDHKRLKPFGRMLRKSSLDELPELINVLRGEMSLVGPRPLLIEYLDLYSPEQARRHEVKPGITGWAQVNGRNAISWERKFELDNWYIDNWSFWLDVKILFMTFIKVVGGKGIGQRDDTTTDKFRGN
ncbi:MAG: sugar transferase [Candidatus Thiodiazotropha sp.]